MPSTNYLALYNFGTPWGQTPRNATSTPPTASPGNLQPSGGQPGAGPYGQLPQVPDPLKSQKGAIGGNLGNLGKLGDLFTGLNTQIAQNAALPYQLNLPQYGAMTGQSSNNILSLLKGQVPADVANQIAQMAAERGVSTGAIGSPNSNAALLRALGLTSLGLQQQGETELSGAVARTPTGKQFDPTTFLVSPSDVQGSQYLANLLASAPDPTAAANAGLLNAFAGLGLGSRMGTPPNQGFRSPMSASPSPVGLGYNGVTPGFGPGGFPNPSSPGTFGGSSSYQPGGQDLESLFWDSGGWGGGGGGDWQTGMPLDNYSPDIFGEDIFG